MHSQFNLFDFIRSFPACHFHFPPNFIFYKKNIPGFRFQGPACHFVEQTNNEMQSLKNCYGVLMCYIIVSRLGRTIRTHFA